MEIRTATGRRPAQAGLTLVELLVVVAVTAMLAALLYPVYASARTSGRRARCQHNLQQIGRAFQLYLSDFDEFYPNTEDPYLWMGRRWRWPMRRYALLAANRNPGDPSNPYSSVGTTRGILSCPEDDTPKAIWDDTSYAYSACFYHRPADVDSMTLRETYDPTLPGPPCVSQPSSAVRQPARKVLAGEWMSNHTSERNDQGKRFGWWEWGGTRNYVFADGHVRFLQSRHIRPPAGDDCPDVNRTRGGLSGADI
jgi:prepilin-type N-terminal cleavage/methylation domain-containing protein/prepilin-type processing-associated H-X9-DG protein